jgi:hypothetical protein
MTNPIALMSLSRMRFSVAVSIESRGFDSSSNGKISKGSSLGPKLSRAATVVHVSATSGHELLMVDVLFELSHKTQGMAFHQSLYWA